VLKKCEVFTFVVMAANSFFILAKSRGAASGVDNTALTTGESDFGERLKN
jgi:hypothetical protein